MLKDVVEYNLIWRTRADV